MSKKTGEKPYPFCSGEFGLSEIVLGTSPGCLMPFPNPADIPPAPKVRGYLLPGDKGYVPYKTVPDDDLLVLSDSFPRT